MTLWAALTKCDDSIRRRRIASGSGATAQVDPSQDVLGHPPDGVPLSCGRTHWPSSAELCVRYSVSMVCMRFDYPTTVFFDDPSLRTGCVKMSLTAAGPQFVISLHSHSLLTTDIGSGSSKNANDAIPFHPGRIRLRQ